MEEPCYPCQNLRIRVLTISGFAGGMEQPPARPGRVMTISLWHRWTQKPWPPSEEGHNAKYRTETLTYYLLIELGMQHEERPSFRASSNSKASTICRDRKYPFVPRRQNLPVPLTLEFSSCRVHLNSNWHVATSRGLYPY